MGVLWCYTDAGAIENQLKPLQNGAHQILNIVKMWDETCEYILVIVDIATEISCAYHDQKKSNR